MSYDERCADLARHMLGEGLDTEANIDSLAQRIAQSVENWFEERIGDLHRDPRSVAGLTRKP